MCCMKKKTRCQINFFLLFIEIFAAFQPNHFNYVLISLFKHIYYVKHLQAKINPAQHQSNELSSSKNRA